MVNDDNNEDQTNYSSPDHRVNNSLSLIEEAENEDSASIQHQIGSGFESNVDGTAGTPGLGAT